MSAVMSRSDADFYTSSDDRSVDELDAAIGRLVRQMNADSYRMLILVREFDDRFGWKKWTFKCCAEWLAWRSSISLSAAREKVRTAHALRALPAIAAAFADGSLSYSKVRALTRVAETCDEDLLLAHALDATVSQVEERCRQIRNVMPDSTQHVRRAWECRSLTVWRDEARGTLRLTVEVPIEEGELIVRALDCAVAAGEVTTEVARCRRRKQRHGLVRSAGRRTRCRGEIVSRRRRSRGWRDGRPLPGRRARGREIPHGRGGTRGPTIDTVKRLLCDCSMVTGRGRYRGNPLDVGRKHRTVSTPLKRALYARDRGCTFPGCYRKRYLDGHHLRHWVDGGETSTDNMTLLCTHHHRLLHEGGFNIVRDEGGTLRFVTDDGRSIPRRAIGSRTSSTTTRATPRRTPIEIPHVRDSAPHQRSASGNAPRYEKPERSTVYGAADRGLA